MGMTNEPRVSSDARKRRRVLALQRWFLNPPMKLLVSLGVVPGHVVIETLGCQTGKRRRTVVGAHREGDTIWVVAEQGRRAGWVRNLEAEPEVRVRRRAHWRAADASIVDDDDAIARMATWHRPGHARLVERFGTQLTTIRLDVR